MDIQHPPTKADLLDQIRARRAVLAGLLVRVSDADLLQPGFNGDWTGKDMLAHIADWERRFLRWYLAGKRGVPFQRPEAGMTWDDTDRLNADMLAFHRPRPLSAIRAEYADSYRRILAAAQVMTSEELYTPGFYAWTGDNALILPLRANTDLHYDEHIEHLEAWFKGRG